MKHRKVNLMNETMKCTSMNEKMKYKIVKKKKKKT